MHDFIITKPVQYVDELLVELRKLGVWCRVAGVYMGAVGFCDDLLLLALTRDCMQLMLDTCQRFALRKNLEISTDPNPEKSKTKCIYVCGLAKWKKKPVNLVLNGKQLPWLGRVCSSPWPCPSPVRNNGYLEQKG